MATDMYLYLVKPGTQNNMSTCVGHLSFREVQSSGQTTGTGQKCLDILVESSPPHQPLTLKQGDKEIQLELSWLELNVEIRTSQPPSRLIGRVLIDGPGMVPIQSAKFGPARWLWEMLPEDVERVESSRSASPGSQIFLSVVVTGIAKLIDAASAAEVGVIPVAGQTTQLIIEPSQWDRLLQQLGYTVPPSQAALASAAILDHPSWRDAVSRLTSARDHQREGETYETLRGCLGALEAIVHAPYDKASWVQQLASVPKQKADGLAEMFSGIATYCNKVGHHRERSERDSSGDLPAMPLDHWEADLALGLAQFSLTYALRLRAAGRLVAPPEEEKSGKQASTSDESPAQEPAS